MPTGKLVPPNPTDPVARIFATIAAALQTLRSEIASVRVAMLTPTVPVYPTGDGGAPVTPLETQIAFFGDTPMYYRDGSWHTFGGGAGVSLPIAGKNSTSIDLDSSDDFQQIAFVGSGGEHYGTNDADAAYLSDAGTDGVNILQSGVYRVEVAASECPDDAIIGVLVYTGSGDYTGSGLGGNSDPLMSQRYIPQNPTINPLGSVQQAFGVFYVTDDDIAGGVIATLGAIVPSGWDNDNADHSVIVTREGDIGTFPPSGFD